MVKAKPLVICGLLLSTPIDGARARADSSQGSAVTPAQSVKETPVTLSTVDSSNGIDSSEARAIAEAYFSREYGACGGPGAARRKRRTWVFPLSFGVSGEKLRETIEWTPREADSEASRVGLDLRVGSDPVSRSDPSAK
jgi:hypothetical protein